MPVTVSPAPPFSSIFDGQLHACGLTSTGHVRCWGNNFHGQLGNGSGGPGLISTTPVPVVGPPFKQIAAGGGFTCALTFDGSAYCWGYNSSGQLGNGSTTEMHLPTPVAGGLHFSSIDAGDSHACGILPGGQTCCWGLNGYGQIGDGTTTDSNLPVYVVW